MSASDKGCSVVAARSFLQERFACYITCSNISIRQKRSCFAAVVGDQGANFTMGQFPIPLIS